MPPSLFPNPALSLNPESGRTEPRLWVRRMVIWREPGQVVRDITLRRGLNIVWSPDPETKDAPIGHGGGKTTFCRLLRYCLGEDSFSPVGQRRRIWDSMPEGLVGAGGMIDSTCWAFVRPFGSPRRDVVVKNAASVEEAFSEEAAKLDISDLRRHLTE